MLKLQNTNLIPSHVKHVSLLLQDIFFFLMQKIIKTKRLALGYADGIYV